VVCRIPLLLNEEWVHVITEEEGGGFRSVPLDESKFAIPLVESKGLVMISDDLPILRDDISTESIAPIYLDPPRDSC
jgi:hypothetical protein